MRALIIAAVIAASIAQTFWAESGKVIAALASPLTLGRSAAIVTLEPSAHSQMNSSLKSEVEHLMGSERIYLVLGDFRIDRQPGVVYSVYLEPAGTGPNEWGEADVVGTLNFFGVNRRTKSPRFVSFDITESAVKLVKVGRLSAKTRIAIVPKGEPALDANPVVGRIELIVRVPQKL